MRVIILFPNLTPAKLRALYNFIDYHLCTHATSLGEGVPNWDDLLNLFNDIAKGEETVTLTEAGASTLQRQER